MKGFWGHLWSGSNATVNSATVLAVALVTLVTALASACIIFHVFILRKGIDGAVSNLLLGMLGAATGGIGAMGVSMFSQTTLSQFTSIESPEAPPQPPVKAVKPE